MKRIGTRRLMDEEQLGALRLKCNWLCSDGRVLTRARGKLRARFFGRNDYGFDGVKRESVDGGPIKPFRGSANNVLRWGDLAADTERSLILEVARRAEVRVVALDGGEDAQARASRLTRLLRWGIGHMGEEWERQLALGVSYMLIDSPAVALMGVEWERREIVGPRRISRRVLFEGMLRADETLRADELLDACERGEPDIRMVQLAAGLLGSDMRTAERVLVALGEEEEVEWTGVTGVDEGPVVRAWQFGTDFILPKRCSDFGFVSPWFRCEWVTVPRFLDLARMYGWSAEFVEASLQQCGASAADFDDARTDLIERQDMVHLVWAYTMGEDDAGRLCRWVTVYSAAQGVSACGMELIDGGHWPAVFWARERNSDNLLDSRGIAMLSSSAQDLAKKLADTGSNNAIIGGLPPAVLRGSETKVSLTPLSVIRLNSSAELKWLQPPAYPAQGNSEVARLRDELLEYLGVQTKGADGEAIGVRRRNRMAQMLEGVKALMLAVLGSIQAHASEELLRAVLGAEGSDPELRRDVRGAFRLSLEVNVDDLVTKTVVEKVQAFGQVVGALDRNRQLDTAPILRAAVRSLFPDVGDEALKGVEAGSAAELKEEQGNFVKIKAGLRPEMNVDGGWNYALRLRFWQEQMQTNPGAFEEMSEEVRQFAQAWVQALEQQARQFGENADLGRTGSPLVAAER